MYSTVQKLFFATLFFSLGLLYVRPVFSIVGDVQLDVSTGGQIIGSALMTNKFTDAANTDYYLDPAAATTSLTVAGSVGIGTTGPATKLEVAGTDNTGAWINIYNSAVASTSNTATLSLSPGYDFRTGSSSPFIKGYMEQTGTWKAGLQLGTYELASGGLTTKMTITGTGNVGIGTTAPGFKLDVGTGSFKAANISRYYLTRTIADATNSWMELGTITTNIVNQPLKYRVTINHHANNHQDSVEYVGFNFVSTVSPNWVQIPPANGFSYHTRTTALEAQQGADWYTAKLRVRNLRSGGGYDGTAYITVEIDNGTLTESSSTGTDGTSVAGYAAGSTGWYFPVQSAGQYTASSNGLFINPSGNVGIGTTDPTDELTVGTFSSGNLSLSGSLSGYAAKTYPTLKTNGATIHFDAQGTYTGYISYNTGFMDISDEKLKTNIAIVGNALDKISQIRGITFAWKDGRDDYERHMGVSAQDVEKVAPELVTQPKGINEKGVFYGGLNALTIEAVKELDIRTKSIESSGRDNLTITGNVGIGTKEGATSKLQVVGLPEYADNAKAIAAGLTTGAFYRTGDILKVVH